MTSHPLKVPSQSHTHNNNQSLNEIPICYCTERCSKVTSNISCILLPLESTTSILHLLICPVIHNDILTDLQKAMHGCRVLDFAQDFWSLGGLHHCCTKPCTRVPNKINKLANFVITLQHVNAKCGAFLPYFGLHWHIMQEVETKHDYGLCTCHWSAAMPVGKPIYQTVIRSHLCGSKRNQTTHTSWLVLNSSL